ncbi:MAG: hypothetical protein WD079_04025 [Phycisphaeraceae bacterium]
MSDERTLPPDHDHWLVRPRTIRLLWIVFIAILVLTIIPDLFIDQYDHFGIEATFGFFAWFGFLTCVVMVVAAKLLGYLVKRKDSYYDA